MWWLPRFEHYKEQRQRQNSTRCETRQIRDALQKAGKSNILVVVVTNEVVVVDRVVLMVVVVLGGRVEVVVCGNGVVVRSDVVVVELGSLTGEVVVLVVVVVSEVVVLLFCASDRPAHMSSNNSNDCRSLAMAMNAGECAAQYTAQKQEDAGQNSEAEKEIEKKAGMSRTAAYWSLKKNSKSMLVLVSSSSSEA